MRIDILGTSFVVQSDQDPAYLREVVEYLKAKTEEIKSSVSTNDPLKISILASMLIIDEYFKHRSGNPVVPSLDAIEASSIAQKMIRELDSLLEKDPPAPKDEVSN